MPKPRVHLTGLGWLGGGESCALLGFLNPGGSSQALTCDLDPPSPPRTLCCGGGQRAGAAARSSQTGGAARAGVSKSQASGKEG